MDELRGSILWDKVKLTKKRGKKRAGAGEGCVGVCGGGEG
jgi:hypothetical protein